MISQGVSVQQNPDVVRHIVGFLSHDSDNRLTAINQQGRRNHTFRLAILAFIAAITLLMFAIPLVALYRGDMLFVTKFMDEWMRYFLIAALSLLAGAKLPDFFK